MNKTELSEKWSKYCNTDKLVDDTMALLSMYGHRNTEHGVCVLLDTYFTNKEPLIKLFATSKNYIGDMRIAAKKEFERKVASGEISMCLKRMGNALNFEQLLKYVDENNQKLYDYLPTGKKSFTIQDLPDSDAQAEKIKKMKVFYYNNAATKESTNIYNQFMDYIRTFSGYTQTTISSYYADSLIAKGTKTSRAFNKVCLHFGVDKFGAYPTTVEENGEIVEKIVYPYNKHFAEYSDLVSGLTRKMDFVISLNPLDYLTMSFGVNWRSCHHIDGGGWKGGTLSYMLDTTSIITFFVDKIDGNIHEIPKIYRQMYHYENNLFIQSRLYPQGNDGAVNLYDKFRGFMIEEFAELLKIEGDWTSETGARGHIITDGCHYKDYNNNRNANIFYPIDKKNEAARHIMEVGHKGICTDCGAVYTDSYNLAHPYRHQCSQ